MFWEALIFILSFMDSRSDVKARSTVTLGHDALVAQFHIHVKVNIVDKNA
jgi:hypothetical protein